MSRYRIELLAVFLLTILALVVLSAGLSQVEFRDSKFLNSESISELRSLLAELKVHQVLLFTVILIGATIIFVWSLLSKKRSVESPRPKGKLALFIQITLWAIAILILRRQIIRRQFNLNPLNVSSGAQIAQITEGQTIPAVSSNVPEWLAFISSLIIILVIGFILWRIYQLRKRPKETIELLSREAQNVIETIQAGDDLRNVILRCYYQMARILHDRRGILRKQAMTPREFEQRLVELGFPREPVGQLTQLFEAVRYGSKELGDKAEFRAIACLEAIVSAAEGVS